VLTARNESLNIIQFNLHAGTRIAQSIWQLGYKLDDRGIVINSKRQQDLFVCSQISTPVLRITQHSVQFVWGFFHGNKAVGGEVGQATPSSSEDKNEWS
jgi:hypothetical protein